MSKNMNTIPFDVACYNSITLSMPPITLSIPLEPMTILRSTLSLVSEPDTMIPLLPGESIHLGYIPISEEDAFAKAKSNPYYGEYMESLSRSHFRVSRGKLSLEKLTDLIHRFTSINIAVDVLVPKREWINSATRRAIYETKVVHRWKSHRAIIMVRILAVKDPDEFVIYVERYQGSVTAHRMLLNTLEQYITSEGQSYPIIRSISASRTALEAAEPPPADWSQIWRPYLNGKLEPTTRIDDPEDIYNAEKSDVEYDEEDDPCTPEGGNTLPDGSKSRTTSWIENL